MCHAAIVRSLDQLSKPAARLRGIEAVWVNGGSGDVGEFPFRKVRGTGFPINPFSIRGKDKGSFACANQYAYSGTPFTTLR